MGDDLDAVSGMGDASDARQPTLKVVLQHLDGHAELLVIGELDIGSAPTLQRELDRLIADGHDDVRLNLSALNFLDAFGVGVLTRINRQLTGLGGRLTVTEVRGIPLRVLTICAMLENLTTGRGRPTTIHRHCEAVMELRLQRRRPGGR